jgi:mono/diheme cytochrome c family protein
MSVKTFYSSIFALVILSLIVFTGCGGGDEAAQKKSNAATTSSGVENTSGLSDFQLENGIGPVTEKLTLGEIDLAKASKGEKIFNEKCASCHKLDEKYVGPAQRDVTTRRTPEYIINMIMNPDEMGKKHPESKKLLAEYLTQMPFQNVTMDDALNILEYFRSVNPKK